ncbi:MAG: hypothetical protein K8M05_33850, partial [Deltaproteobacteria bacterium]|nr:hypothetical protein [Kofleriaceae bacterium]
MVERRLLPALVFAVTVLSPALGCGAGGGDAEPDSGATSAVDAPRNTDFRDASCSPGSGSGSGSGSDSGSDSDSDSDSDSGSDPDSDSDSVSDPV